MSNIFGFFTIIGIAEITCVGLQPIGNDSYHRIFLERGNALLLCYDVAYCGTENLTDHGIY